MHNQVIYYNDFGKRFEQDILRCPDPAFWTTDYASKGRIYTEMKVRVEEQFKQINSYFKNDLPVLDIGCGFGRQAFLLAKNGFSVSATDTSKVFIEIAEKLFKKDSLKADFYCCDILASNPIKGKFRQILLLDVLEHIKPFQRKKMFSEIYKLSEPGACVLMSLPHLKKKTTSMINNNIRKQVTQHFNFFLTREEHPYPVPSSRDIRRLCSGLFNVEIMKETLETDYYVLRRI